MIEFLATAVAFIALDSIWLSLMSKRLYRAALGSRMREKTAMAPTVAFYAIYSLALAVLVTTPALMTLDPGQAFLNGLIFGLAGYATYNLTNAATLKDWPPLIVGVDLAWGTIASGVAAWLAVEGILRFAAAG